MEFYRRLGYARQNGITARVCDQPYRRWHISTLKGYSWYREQSAFMCILTQFCSWDLYANVCSIVLIEFGVSQESSGQRLSMCFPYWCPENKSTCPYRVASQDGHYSVWKPYCYGWCYIVVPACCASRCNLCLFTRWYTTPQHGMLWMQICSGVWAHRPPGIRCIHLFSFSN